ncbi:penicillin-binding protein 2 [Microbulbifer flavimaris]|uniref:Peptidoglycan D,D-transpeptidase MrdA n=1 Tax=Microbulbifer flavimaris TaxID=1781068 RepID=A0ABX4HXF9_9GAMM|nr:MULTISPECIES: penicillin-binding protein 2 [Microbulbifer]KUJ82474.1 penicillin-binding protein 2 [Microbulbifer sp. ZGT114]PCO04678.1 penicillin-binding protein 2 [Microbulbifer flavimaris]
MAHDLHLKDPLLEQRLFRNRMLVALVGVVVLLGVLVARFYNLQVVNHDDYRTQSDENRIQVRPVPATRGLIYDRNGALLADNRPSYTLSIVRERVRDMDGTLELIGRLVQLDDADVEKFRQRLQRRRPFEPVPLRYRLSEREIARVSVNEFRLPGVSVEAELVRYYPMTDLFAHSVGYVGRISERELAAFSEEDVRRYRGMQSIGKVGLEKSYEEVLLGEVGFENVETNARGRVLRVLERHDPQPGSELMLHMDARLQKVATEALGDNRGSVVAIDVKTGGVLAFVSKPSFDPNLFVTGISFKDYKALRDSIDVPLFNRAVQGQYPPGSTLKPLMGLGGLAAGVIDRQTKIKDPGWYKLPNDTRLYRDWKRWGHGKKVDLIQALAESCDVYFYDMAHRWSIDGMHDIATRFGLGAKTGIDLPVERPGLYPSRAWKRGARGMPWFPGDNLNAVLGQGFVLATPLQLAVMTATIANRGTHYKPQVVMAIDGVEQPPEVLHHIEARPEHWDLVFEGMEAVVYDLNGTGKKAGADLDFRVAGKTGTAQVVGIAQGEEYDSEALKERHRDHALFVSFAPMDDPQIAVAVLVENGESGGGVAAPVAREVFAEWLSRPLEETASVLPGPVQIQVGGARG